MQDRYLLINEHIGKEQSQTKLTVLLLTPSVCNQSVTDHLHTDMFIRLKIHKI